MAEQTEARDKQGLGQSKLKCIMGAHIFFH